MNLEKASQDREKLPWTVGTVMNADTHINHSIIPLLDTFNREIREISDKSVAEYLFGSCRDIGFLDCVVNITDKTDSIWLNDLDLLNNRKTFICENSNMSRNKVESSTNNEMTRVVSHDGLRLRLVTIVEEEGDWEGNRRVRHERGNSSHEVGVGEN
jgi:hypothetical protein